MRGNTSPVVWLHPGQLCGNLLLDVVRLPEAHMRKLRTKLEQQNKLRHKHKS